MKYCPHCNDYALYDDDIELCPVCHTRLETYVFDQQSEDIIYETNEYSHEDYTPQQTRAFYTHQTFYDSYHGLVVDVNHYTQIYPFFMKIIRSLFLGEPMQLGVLSHYTAITLEEIRFDQLPEQRRVLNYYGDLNGRVYVGQVVDIETKFNRHDIRRIVDSESRRTIRPAFAISRWLFVILLLLIPVWVPVIMQLIVSVIGGGLALLSGFIFNIIIVLAIIYIIKSIF